MVKTEHLGNIIPSAGIQKVTAAEPSAYLVCATLGAIQRGVQLCFTGCVSFHQAPEPSTHQMLKSQSKEVQLLLLEMPAIIMGYTSKLRQSFSSESRGIQLVWEQLFFKGWLALSGEAGNMKEIDGCHWQEQNLPQTKSVLFKLNSFHKNKSGPLKKNPIWEATLGTLEPCQMLRCPRCLITPIFKKDTQATIAGGSNNQPAMPLGRRWNEKEERMSWCAVQQRRSLVTGRVKGWEYSGDHPPVVLFCSAGVCCEDLSADHNLISSVTYQIKTFSEFKKKHQETGPLHP